MIKVINALLAILSGVLSSLLLYYVLNKGVEHLPKKWENRLKPYVFVGPAVLLIGFFLIYPAVRTVVFSFANNDSTKFIGTKNYTDLLGSPDFVSGALLNTLLWMIAVPALTVVLGLAVAVLADRLQPRAEKFTKSLIFLPMAISLVGAATIWRFVYASNPAGTPQVGLLNGDPGQVRDRPGLVAADQPGARQQPAADGDHDLGAGRFRHGASVRGGQRRA